MSIDMPGYTVTLAPMKFLHKLSMFAILSALALPLAGQAKQHPNILFIAMDDLNDWIGPLGGHPQAITPNLDRLAAEGILFTNAHCPAASCNPSRTAIMTGLAPTTSGLYRNDQNMREALPDAELLPAWFRRHGYQALGSGKMLHYFIDQRSWDAYFPAKEREDPFPRTYYPKERPVSLPHAGDWMYRETDWAELPVDDQTYGGDYLVSQWVAEQLGVEHDRPFFLACGIYRPHEPWFVPEKYYEPFPLESIQLPPGYREDDLDDVPPLGQSLGRNRYFAHIQKHGQWKHGVRGYLASIYFADAMLGRVLDALEQSAYADNTIVVLWSDHGWHLGEKEHWQKYTGWRVCTRVPLMIKVPPGVSTLVEGTPAGVQCDQPVSLLDLFPTLTRLCRVPPKADNDGYDLTPLLRKPDAAWPHVAVTALDRLGRYAISGREYRYIHYEKGGEELYHIPSDRYEWTNLAGDPTHRKALMELRARAPRTPAPMIKTFTRGPRPPVKPKREVRTIPASSLPPVSPTGEDSCTLLFTNSGVEAVTVSWITFDGKQQIFHTLKQGEKAWQGTHPGHVWIFSNPAGKAYGGCIAPKQNAWVDLAPGRVKPR